MAAKEQEAHQTPVEFTKVPGYDHFDNEVQPPPYKDVYPTVPGEAKIFTAAKDISETEARQAMQKECARHTTWKKSAVDKMVINHITPGVTYYYVVESFCETRTSAYVTEPYLGQPLDTPAMGAAPLPWDIQCFPLKPFTDEVKLIEVPHTSTVQICTSCKGVRGAICFFCQGRGQQDCFFCKGTGSKTMAAPNHGPHMPQYPPVQTSCAPNVLTMGQHPCPRPPVCLPTHPRVMGADQCFHCHGHGMSACTHCQARGWKNCDSCAGTGQQRSFVRLTVNFKVEKSEFLTQHGDVPEDKMKKSEAVPSLSEEGQTIAPINNHSSSEINRVSEQFINEHNMKAKSCRILLQRHCLKAIPTAAVVFSMPGSTETYQFYVYGDQKDAYIKSFPSKCSIL